MTEAACIPQPFANTIPIPGLNTMTRDPVAYKQSSIPRRRLKENFS